MSKDIEKKGPPMKYLLECSDGMLGSFELAKLGEVANLRSEMLALFDKLVDRSAQAVLAAWLRTIDRNELRRQLLEPATVTIEGIMDEAKAEIRNQGRSLKEIDDYGKMPSPGFLRKLPPEEAHRRRLESNKRREERHIAEGKCRNCSAPLCRESVELCEKHFVMKREAQRRRRGTVHAHGRHPNTLKALMEAARSARKPE